jgi:hypothetical protein
VVIDIDGLRAAALTAEGLRHFATVHSPHDISVLGEKVSNGKANEALARECCEADHIFISPQTKAVLEIVEEFGLWEKTAVLDFTDPPEVAAGLLDKCSAYFKRSWSIGPERRPRAANSPKLFPLNFAALAAFERLPDVTPDMRPSHRPIDVGFYFARADLDHPGYQNRLRVLRVLESKRWPNRQLRIGHHTFGPGHGQDGRTAIIRPVVDPRWLDYMRLLTSTKIIFTATPYGYDGDHRTWEALWSGACVFMDRTSIPTPDLPRGNVECFYYDSRDDESIEAAVEWAETLLRSRDGQDTIDRIGAAGRRNVIAHHLSHHRADYVVRLMEGRTLGPVPSF